MKKVHLALKKSSLFLPASGRHCSEATMTRIISQLFLFEVWNLCLEVLKYSYRTMFLSSHKRRA